MGDSNCGAKIKGSGHVWRLGQVADLRESGELVLIQVGTERYWIEAKLACAIGMVGSRIVEPAAGPDSALRLIVAAAVLLLILGFVLL